jgi:hypothetical protein
MDFEVDIQIAERVMGWRAKPNSPLWHDADGTPWLGEHLSYLAIQQWHPSSSIEDAWLVEGEIERRGLTEQYARALIEVVGGSDMLRRHEMRGLWDDQMWMVIHATAEQAIDSQASPDGTSATETP